VLLAPDDPWSAYARTVVEISPPDRDRIVVRAAAPDRCGAWPWTFEGPLHVLTAWNPGTDRPTLAENRLRQSRLEAELRPGAAVLWTARGWDPVTGEHDEGVAVTGLSEEAVLGLGAHYGQDAVFSWSPREWAIVACAGGRRVASGWTSSRGRGRSQYYVRRSTLRPWHDVAGPAADSSGPTNHPSSS
jgi:uncharacterized protein DUF3293